MIDYYIVSGKYINGQKMFGKSQTKLPVLYLIIAFFTDRAMKWMVKKIAFRI